jgi:hypothetical protein
MAPEDQYPKDMQEQLDEFSSEAERLIGSFVKTLTAQRTPDRIYHYTNDIGLKGILEKLWLTDIFELNDPSELNHGLVLPSEN